MAKSPDALEIAKHFFAVTERRPTKGTMGMTIKQALNLLDAKFTKDEVKIGIEWAHKHPPRNGFQSLGWLSYDLENILKKVRAQQKIEEMKNVNTIIEENKITFPEHIEHKRKSSDERVGKDFNFDMFE